ncbi:MAG TPA: putative Ig domain-containing protein [Actinomycetota bacterium]|nr:putative Ig domain-containing protein [Actinomycetota bacterium]
MHSTSLRARLGAAGVAALLAATLVVSAGPPAQAQTPFGTPPALPAGASLGAALPGSTPVHLTFVLQPSNPGALAAEVQAVSTPGSPRYGHYLTPVQFAQQFGASPATIAQVTDALQAQGLTGARVAANHLSLAIDAPASTVEAALAPHERAARLRTGRSAYVNTAPPQIPVSVAPAISAVLGLDTLAQATPQWAPAQKARAPASPAAILTPAAAGPQACSAATTAAGQAGAFVPAQLASAYGLGSLYASNDLGAGQSIALFELAGFSNTDISTFQTCFGTATSISVTQVDGGSGSSPGTVESTLDIEDVIGLAPQAAIKVYEGVNTGQGIYNVYSKIVSDDTSKVVSTSWGLCESLAGQGGSMSLTSAEATLFSEAALQGQTVLSATGDQGAEACYDPNAATPDTSLAVSDPASQINVTAVGGTKLTAIGPAPTEAAYNESHTQSGAGGGGISTLWTMPSWQTGTGVINGFSSGSPCGAVSGSFCREIPDVSASSDPFEGYVIYYTGTDSGIPSGWSSLGGTSAAAPLWATVIALANESCGTTLGAVNAALYRASAAGGAFNDVTSGNIAYVGSHGTDYPATTAFDLATGLGSPIAGTLVPDLCPPAPPVFTADTPTTPASAGTAYSYSFTASGSPAPTFSLTSGTLPPGLTLNATGVLSGTPTTGGTYSFVVKASNSAGSATTPSLGITVNQAPAFTADSPPNASAGAPYSYTFTASGFPAPTFALNTGSLPTGLSLSPGGVLSGTPTTGGSFTFTVKATNSVATATTPSLTIQVTKGPAFTADSPPGGTVGTPYTYTFTASGSPAPTFSVATGSLPPGLGLNATTGVLSGTPTTGGQYSFAVSASNSAGQVTSPSLPVTIAQAPALTAASPPSSATAGTAYSYTFTASGFPAPAFSVATGSLPPGLVLTAAGVLSGTPTAGGPFSFTVAATNSAGTATGGTLTITVSQAPAFTADSPPASGAMNSAYSYTFAASGYPAPTFVVNAGQLPPGLSLTSGGTLSGIPTSLGSFTFTVAASNGVGSTAVSASHTITIANAPAFTADTPPPTVTVSTAFSYTFVAAGNPAPTYSLASGTLPTGLSLNASGVLSGTPTAAGLFTFTVAATNSSGTATTPSISMTIGQAPAFTADTPPATTPAGTAVSYSFTAAGSPAPSFALAGGTLPTGLSLASSGALSGTPTTGGAFGFTVAATNSFGTAVTPVITMTVTQAPAFTADTPPSPATIQTAYSYTFAASGFPAPTFSVAGGSLPPGISLSAAGVLSGAPNTAGSFTFTVLATNTVGSATSPSLTIMVTNAPAFTADSPPVTATVGTAYAYTFAAGGSPAPTYAVQSGQLPPGLALDATMGVLSGTPTAGGQYSFVVAATNPSGSAATPTLAITVGQAPAFTADTPQPVWVVGAQYTYTFTASGYPAPTFSLASGQLPPGLALASSGALSGTPSAAGAFSFTVKAANAVGAGVTTPSLTIVIVVPGPQRTGDGYWEVASDGGLFSYGDAGFFGSAGAIHLNQPIVGMVATPDGKGYWEVASDGGLFSYGDAGFFGSAGAIHLNKPIVGMAATPDGKGYWEVASDGGLFSYGDAGFFGSAGAVHLNQPIVGMAVAPDGQGYWEVASDGGLFSYGDAGFFGSAGAVHLNQPIVGLSTTPDGKGYWEVASDGGLFSYGDAGFHGSAGAIHLNKPIVGMFSD